MYVFEGLIAFPVKGVIISEGTRKNISARIDRIIIIRMIVDFFMISLVIRYI